jgi:uncharacterized ParB-like nuclease family protein
MSRNCTPILTLSVLATAALTADRFVTAAGAVPAAGASALGVGRANVAIGERQPVDVLGTSIVEAGAAMTANDLVQCDASGRAITKAAGVTLGRLAPGEAPTAAGQFVEIILLPATA